MSGFDNILYEVENGRARITLNRPEKLNAMTLALQAELHGPRWEAGHNNDVQSVILQGNDRAFGRCYDPRAGGAPAGGAQRASAGCRGPEDGGDDQAAVASDPDALALKREGGARLAEARHHRSPGPVLCSRAIAARSTSIISRTRS